MIDVKEEVNKSQHTLKTILALFSVCRKANVNLVKQSGEKYKLLSHGKNCSSSLRHHARNKELQFLVSP